ncbi:hypothetical protein PspLS_11925 [Pyricularia sp. CBS 133598]|nr:hypothetical protein PspLS_11925 [Pyricularia sp. CBS 133598]
MTSPEPHVYASIDDQLSYILLTELLSYQFCSAVQWIASQDSFLGGASPATRIIEVGPGQTLVNMARKTLKAKFAAEDAAHGRTRELLSLKKDTASIYYRTDGEILVPVQTTKAAAPVATPATDPATIAEAAQLKVAIPQETAAMPLSAQPSSIPDSLVTPREIITLLISTALKKPRAEVATDKPISDLCGGRSTIQNEIIGDLTKEFGNIPEQPESMSISELATNLSGGKLGSSTTAMVSKMVSMKMCAGTTVSSLKKALEGQWAFGPGLQDKALLAAVAMQPDTRLPGPKDMDEFVARVAASVLQDMGIDPSSLGNTQDPRSGVSTDLISSEALDTMREELRGHDKAVARAFARRTGDDVTTAAQSEEIKTLRAVVDESQRRLDMWTAEFGAAFEAGIVPSLVGRSQKARIYDSWWNWAVQDILELFEKLAFGVNVPATWVGDRIAALERRSDSRMVPLINNLLEKAIDLPAGLGKTRARELMGELHAKVVAATREQKTVFKHVVESTSPVLRYGPNGKLIVEEKIREFNCEKDRKCESPTLSDVSASGILSDVSASGTLSDVSASTTASEISMCTPPSEMSGFATSIRFSGEPFIKTFSEWDGWSRNKELSESYIAWFADAAASGISFTDKTVLLTGAGRNSIGVEMLSLLLSAGSHILVTTSSYSSETLLFYQDLYRTCGAKGSRLVVLPFNAASQQDIDALVTYIYKDLAWDLDHIVPFAAIGEAGRGVDRIDSVSELAHRAMLTNLVRLLGAVKVAKETRGIWTHPTHVLLPMSPNHGSFGQDGLYAESKISLESLLNKWSSEGWGDYLSLCGAVIGWTRGTGLMAGNDAVAAGVETDLGVRTFSKHEMAWHLVGLLDSQSLRTACDFSPLIADLSGGMRPWMKVRSALDRIRKEIQDRAEVEKVLALESGLTNKESHTAKMKPRAQLRVDSLELPNWDTSIRPMAASLQGMVDLNKVVVVVGFGEAGPCGSSRTRWEIETKGALSIEGAVELAWIMGLIKYHQGPLPSQPQSSYAGWIETKTNSPITDAEVKAKYEAFILKNTGIRPSEAKTHDLTAAGMEQELEEIILQADMDPVAVSAETAAEMAVQHGDKVSVSDVDGQMYVTLKAGATTFVPKVKAFHHTITAQMPKGWDARRYGVPDDIISQVDPVTLYALVAASEALLSAGLPDPFELYTDLGCSVADVGNCVGSGMGGLRAVFNLFKGKYLQRDDQKDVLAESFVNTPAAWLNMLLLGAAGPIRTPVGACATGLESLDNAYDLLVRGRAKLVLAGGTESMERDTAQGFANMGATVNASSEADKGRSPKEASRPMASTRAGFVEAEGCGVQILATASTAIELGLPIHGIIAFTHTASDGIGRSLPAPGKGVLTSAAEIQTTRADPQSRRMLDLDYRRRQLEASLSRISRDQREELCLIDQSDLSASDQAQLSAELTMRAEAAAQSVRQFYCSREFYANDKTVSPMRGALAVWGLTIDDVAVASLHGTSTVMGDINETKVLQRQLEHLGRTPGNVMSCVCQKSVVGHAKAGAGAMAMNGALQVMTNPSRTVPGNPNLDNVDAKLRDMDLLFFPGTSQPVAQGLVKAFTVCSFGFGQKGAQVVGVNPQLLFASLPGGEAQYAAYVAKASRRRARANKVFHESLYGGKKMVNVKSESVCDTVTGGEIDNFLLTRR